MPVLQNSCQRRVIYQGCTRGKDDKKESAQWRVKLYLVWSCRHNTASESHKLLNTVCSRIVFHKFYIYLSHWKGLFTISYHLLNSKIYFCLSRSKQSWYCLQKRTQSKHCNKVNMFFTRTRDVCYQLTTILSENMPLNCKIIVN